MADILNLDCASTSENTDDSVAKTDFESLTQAAQWYATLHSENVTNKERQAWQRWLNQSSMHVSAWRHIEAVSSKFEPLRIDGNRQAALAGAQVARKTAITRRRALNGIASILGASVLGWFSWRYTPVQGLILAYCADYHTAIGEQRDIELADGTRLWLNTDSAIDVTYGQYERLVNLLTGEILIDTAKDTTQRPFYVKTPFGRLQALGTKFTVRAMTDQVQLDVFDGTVQVVTEQAVTRRIATGQQVRFNAATITTTERANQARQVWSQGVVLADNVPLKNLIDELGRYRRGHISLEPSVAELNVMGVYPAKNSDLALSMLEKTLPIRVRHILPWWTTIEAH